MTHLRAILLSGLLAPVFTAPVHGQVQSAQPDELQALVACRSIAETSQRAACFDQALNAFTSALDSGDLALVERGVVRQVERDGFGLEMPGFGGLREVFNRSRTQGENGQATEEIELLADGSEVQYAANGDLERMSNVPVSAVRDTGRGIVVTLANGHVWRQTDSTRTLPVRDRHFERGLTAEIERGALTSFWLRLSHDNRRMRAERVQ